MEFHQTTRSQFNDTPEFAAKRLPLHPTARYGNFSEIWKNTRNRQYVPRPKQLRSDDDLFPCCLSCVAQSSEKEDASEPLWHRKAYAGWLQAEWYWDFGRLLPEEFVWMFGLGITPPPMPVERDRVFVHRPDFSRGYLDLSLGEHAQCKGEQHEAKFKVITTIGGVNYPGEMVISTGGQIWIAIPRAVPFGAGKSVSERFIFQAVQMPHNLPILIHGDRIKVENGKVTLDGILLN